MKTVKSLIVAAFLSVAFCDFENFSEMETTGILSLAEYFKISHCVLEKKISEMISVEIHPAKRKLLTATMNFDEISDLLNGKKEKYSKVGKTMIVLKMDEETMAALHELSQTESLSSVTWIIFSSHNLRAENFRKIHIPFDCEFVHVQVKKDFFAMTEIYRLTRDSNLETYDLGNRTKTGGLNLVDVPFYARRNNLGGHEFQAAIHNYPPYVKIKKTGRGRKPVFEGFLFEIWRELELRINFRTKFPEKYFDQDVGQILKKKDVDFALGRITMNSRDLDFMDFSQPLIISECYAFGHRHGPQLNWDSYLRPFSSDTWFVNLIWMLSSSFAFAILYRVAWNFGTSEKDAKHYLFTLSESFLTVFRAICMQGSDVTPNSHSCRLFFLSIFMTASVVTSSFSAALFSLLTIPKQKSSFKSLNELLNGDEYKIALPFDSEFRKSFQDFSNSFWSSQSILREKLAESKLILYSEVEKGLNRICHDEFFLFIYDMPNVIHHMRGMNRVCQEKIVPLDRSLFAEYISFGFRKINPYRKLFHIHLTRMKSEGIINRILLNYWPPPISMVRPSWVRVTLSDISPILYMFVLGAISGLVILTIEKMIMSLRKMKKRKKRNAPPFGRGRFRSRWLPSAFG